MTTELIKRCKDYEYDDKLIEFFDGIEELFKKLGPKKYTLVEWIDLGMSKGFEDFTSLTEREKFLIALFMIVDEIGGQE